MRKHGTRSMPVNQANKQSGAGASGWRISCWVSVMGLLWAFCAGPASGVSIARVAVGDAGNAGETQGSLILGGVPYPYEIGTYEVSNAEYCDFLNAVDPDGNNALSLYSASMGSEVRGGITNVSSAPAGSKYVVKTNMADKPVNYVSLWDAARFCNWLHNGQGSANTEGGAYTNIGDQTTFMRQSSVGFFVPTENEWYKAAYYEPGASDNSYWLYPTRSDSAPTVAAADSVGDISNPGANVANYSYGADWNGLNGNVTTIGSAAASPGDSASYYGTYDQGGNVYEWTEAKWNNIRYYRGGSFAEPGASRVSSTYRSAYGVPETEIASLGFRVVYVPSSINVITNEMVTVGDPGNPGEVQGALTLGGVTYTYLIGAYEVSNYEYCQFLNAVDPDGNDSLSLYNTSMGSDRRGGITNVLTAAPGTKYVVKAHMADKPVNYVSLWDAARFCNWLHNGRGGGDTESGCYVNIGDQNTFARGRRVGFFVPTENEWYKAAYYEPGASGNGYWLYPTRSDAAPAAAYADPVGNIVNTGTNTINYDYAADWNGMNGNVTAIGSAAASPGDSASYYGTYDQGGNVYEWTEAKWNHIRYFRGGSLSEPLVERVSSTYRSAYGVPETESATLGFRVVYVPAVGTCIAIH